MPFILLKTIPTSESLNLCAEKQRMRCRALPKAKVFQGLYYTDTTACN